MLTAEVQSQKQSQVERKKKQSKTLNQKFGFFLVQIFPVAQMVRLVWPVEFLTFFPEICWPMNVTIITCRTLTYK